MKALENETTNPALYRAFISYSHSDKNIARWLHNALEHYHLPKKLVGKNTSLGPVPKKLTPIFRDQDELPASGNLGAELGQALAHSLFLIVICSPASARSKWVNEEVRQFKIIHGADKVLALIVDGVPNASPEDSAKECFAPALKFEVTANGKVSNIPSEAIAADLRKEADGKRLAKLKLVSGLTALRLDDLVQREAARRIRNMIQVSVVSILAAVFAVVMSIYANNQRLEAVAQRAIAEQESATSNAVSDFLVDTFASGNSVEENPNAITARSILDRGAKRVAKELNGQPKVQIRLSETLALAYNNLGLFNQAIDLLDTTAAASGKENANSVAIKAEALMRIGELDASMDTIIYAQALLHKEKLRQYDPTAHKTGARIARIQAKIHYRRGQFEDGIEAFGRALKELADMPEPDNIDIAITLQNRALILSEAGKMMEAAEDLNRARNLVVSGGNDKNILLGQIALAQAQVSFFSSEQTQALQQIEDAIAIFNRILEDDNPSIADAFSMKGQILHAQGQLQEAKIALIQAVSIYTQAYNGRHYLSGIAEVYLGLIAGEQKNLAAALAHFEEAKLHYDASYGEIHANHGDLMVNRATVLAAVGEINRANQECIEGMGILVTTLGKDAPFTKQLQSVCDEIALR